MLPDVVVQSGADVNAKDMLKMTALHWATEHGHRGVAELLVKYGADTHAMSKFDKTPFHIAVDKGNTELMLLLQVLHITSMNSDVFSLRVLSPEKIREVSEH